MSKCCVAKFTGMFFETAPPLGIKSPGGKNSKCENPSVQGCVCTQDMFELEQISYVRFPYQHEKTRQVSHISRHQKRARGTSHNLEEKHTYYISTESQNPLRHRLWDGSFKHGYILLQTTIGSRNLAQSLPLPMYRNSADSAVKSEVLLRTDQVALWRIKERKGNGFKMNHTPDKCSNVLKKLQTV